MKNLTFLFSATMMAAALLLGSCDALEKMTYTDIETDCEIYYPVEATSGISKADGDMVPFYGTLTISRNDPEFAEVEEADLAAKLIKEVKPKKTVMTVWTVGSGTQVTGLTLTAESGGKTIATFGPVNHPINTDTPIDITAFGKEVLKVYSKSQTIKLTISGMSDVNMGEKLTCGITFSPIVTTVGL